ncbi:hypothetical protein [Burkholderia sp. YIM B11467]
MIRAGTSQRSSTLQYRPAHRVGRQADHDHHAREQRKRVERRKHDQRNECERRAEQRRTEHVQRAEAIADEAAADRVHPQLQRHGREQRFDQPAADATVSPRMAASIAAS